MKKLKFFILYFFTFIFFSCGSLPKENELKELSTLNKITLEDFEDLNYWYPIKDLWDSEKLKDSSLSCEISTEWAFSGEQSLKCETSHIPSQKQASFGCNTFIKDFSDAKLISISFKFNEDQKGFVSLGFQTKDGKWFESLPQKISSGTSQYFFETENISDISGFFILLKNHKKKSIFYIDDIIFYN